MTTLQEFVNYAHELWPLSGAEEWDTPGLVTGNSARKISHVLLSVDASTATVKEAIDLSCDVLLTHHPLLLRGVTTVSEDRYKGNLISQLIRHNVALLAAHTNADVVKDGVSEVIAHKLGLNNLVPIVPGISNTEGIGRVGTLSAPITLGEFARKLAEVLPHTAGGVKVAGDYTQPVQKVALCGGAGDSLLSSQEVLEADVYVTSDLRHHPAQEFREQSLISGGPALIDVSHWASEWLWLETAAAQLKKQFPKLTFTVSELRTDPWDFLVVQ